MLGQHPANIGSASYVSYLEITAKMSGFDDHYIMGLTKHSGSGGGPVEVIKAACLESQRSRVRTPLWPSHFKD